MFKTFKNILDDYYTYQFNIKSTQFKIYIYISFAKC